MSNKLDRETLGLMIGAALGNFENGLAAVTPGGIEAQEAREQKRMIANSRLPKQITTGGWPSEDSMMDRWEVLQRRLGIVKLSEASELFYNVQLPEGWEVRASDHAMWSYLHDAAGRKRAGIFYKGSFYDQRADWSLNHRYYASSVYDTPTGEYQNDVATTWGVWDGAENKVLFKGEFFTKEERNDWKKYDAVEQAARDWLVEHFPEHRNPFAYWD